MDRIKRAGILFLGLGYSEHCFEPKVHSECIVVTYGQVRAILEELVPKIKVGSEYTVLIKHYLDFLRRDMVILELLDTYANSDSDSGLETALGALAACDGIYRDNDLRMFRLIYLGGLRNYLESTCWIGAEWRLYKNEDSGVWMAGAGQPSKPFRFRDELVQGDDLKLWFHIVLSHHPKLLSEDDRQVGHIELRCERADGAVVTMDKKQAISSRLQSSCPKWITCVGKSRGKTVGLVKSPFTQSEMRYPALSSKLTEFAKCFGAFPI